MRVKIILNPYSNRWQGQKSVPEIEQTMKANQVDFELALTTEPGAGTTLAESAVAVKAFVKG